MDIGDWSESVLFQIGHFDWSELRISIYISSAVESFVIH